MTELIVQPPDNQTDLSLTGNVFLRFIVIGFMYFSQGLPLGLFGVAFPTYLASVGFTKSEIATFLAVIGLPWAFKFLAGPLMDRFSFLIYGHRRPWVVFAQTGLTLTFAISAMVAGFEDLNLYILAACGFVLNFFSSTQDVAVDGLAIGVLKEHERSTATALMFGSQKIGLLAGSAGGGVLLGSFGVMGACFGAAFTTLMLLMLPTFLKERPVEKQFPWSRGGQIAPEVAAMEVEDLLSMLVDLARKLAAPISLLFIFAFFCDSVAGGLVSAYLPSFSVQDLKWEDDVYNWWYGLVGLIAAGIGLVLSPVFDHFGQRKCLVVIGLLTTVYIFTFAFVPALKEGWGWYAFILIFFVVQHLYAVLLISSCMELVSPQVAASQFAIYMSLANLSTTIGTSFIALVADIWTVTHVLVLAALFVLAAPIIFWFTHLGTRKSKGSLEAKAA